MKTAEGRWQEIQQRFGDLSQVHPEKFKYGMSLMSQLEADPVNTVSSLLGMLATRDEYRQGIASQAARILNGVRGTQPREEPEPQPDLVADNGTPVYSAPQLRAWQDWNSKRSQAALEAQLAQRFQPFERMAKEREAERQQMALVRQQQQAETIASQQYERALSWHGFTAHQPDILAAWDQHPDWSLQDAYLHVLHSKILPSLPAQAQAKVVADLQSKAAAQTLAPATSTRTGTPDFKGDFAAALKYFASNGA